MIYNFNAILTLCFWMNTWLPLLSNAYLNQNTLPDESSGFKIYICISGYICNWPMLTVIPLIFKIYAWIVSPMYIVNLFNCEYRSPFFYGFQNNSWKGEEGRRAAFLYKREFVKLIYSELRWIVSHLASDWGMIPVFSCTSILKKW